MGGECGWVKWWAEGVEESVARHSGALRDWGVGCEFNNGPCALETKNENTQTIKFTLYCNFYGLFLWPVHAYHCSEVGLDMCSTVLLVPSGSR
jgi:hypothetical protein